MSEQSAENAHVGEVLSFGNIVITYRARCSCGWGGKHRRLWLTANDEHALHAIESNASPEAGGDT